ncbi:MAG: DNA translocase FtsK [Clostridiales bacterium]|nr:DNA translocase FtsK [Clostridiales bacterium]
MTTPTDHYNHTIDYDPDNIGDNTTEVVDNSTHTRSRQGRKSKQSTKDPSRLSTPLHEELNSQTKAPRQWPAFIRFFMDKRTHAATGVILIIIATYLVIAAMSYFSTAADDQSKLNHFTVEQMVANGITVDNITGPMGAIAAHKLITNGLGVGSLVLVIYLFIIGVALIKTDMKIHFWSLTLKCLISAIGISLIVGLVDLYFNLESVFPYGGFHGRYINLWLIARIQWIGAIGVSVALLAILTYMYIYDISKLFSKIQKAYRAAHPVIEKKIEEKSTGHPGDNQDSKAKTEPKVDDDTEAGESTGNNHSAYMPHDGNSPATDDDTENITVDNKPEMMTVNVSFDDESITREQDIETDPVDTTDEHSHNQDSDTEFMIMPAIDDVDEVPVVDTTEETNDNTDQPSACIGTNNAEPGFDINVATIEEGKEDKSQLYDPTAELSRYKRPALDLLINRSSKTNNVDRDEQDANKEQITKTLKSYGIPISKIQATVGPTVTLYEIIPAEGVRIAKIKRLEDDIALSLAALGIRIIAPIPGKGTIGIEVPNQDPQTVSMRVVLGSKAFQECKYQLPMAMGATISNDIYIADLAKMPHLLVAGATGQGKSVGLNAIIASLLYKKHPSELKFVLVDPKMVEFSLYSKLKYHFMAQLEEEEDSVITVPEKVERTLNSLCVEMDNRYNLLKDANVRSISEYNEKFAEHRLNPEKGHRYLPYIVIIVDEFADLIMMSGKAIETPIARIAQKARAVGMHMIIATQRPSANVITGIIRANFPGRIAFRVATAVDSKVILDRTGANQLIGRGDMLFSHNGVLERVQCAFIDTPEVEALVDNISSQPGFDHPYYLPEPPAADGDIALGSITERDPLFEDAARFLCAGGDTASTSSLQRKFSIGYNRAGKIMDQLESAGIVSAAQGSKPRNVLIDIFQLESML